MVTVVDACALAQVACGALRDGEQVDLISALAGTGRSNPYGAAHIVEELQQHLPRIAAKTGVPLDRAQEMLWKPMLPGVPIVDLAIGDHLSPASRLLLRDDPKLPAIARGDADDAPTAALAQFPAPAVILTQDSVFTRFGLAVPVEQWVGMAHGLLRAAGYEANLSTSVVVAEIAARLAWQVVAWAGRTAARNPVLAGAVVALAVLVCRHQGLLDAARWRASAVSLNEIAAPLLEKFAAASEDLVDAGGRGCTGTEPGPAAGNRGRGLPVLGRGLAARAAPDLPGTDRRGSDRVGLRHLAVHAADGRTRSGRSAPRSRGRCRRRRTPFPSRRATAGARCCPNRSSCSRPTWTRWRTPSPGRRGPRACRDAGLHRAAGPARAAARPA
ncbi:hypothetical protein [Kitasatospora sp. NPDC127060]|uniref:hypothetical protein n=1 Tax=Kitasatospora sp. NPDC127060 TaxID=3347121 RepID=UPI00364C3ACB